MFELAEKWRLPVVFFAEGGGGRPGDTDGDRRRRPRPPWRFHLLAQAQRRSCRSSASPPAAASPATPRCSAAATSIIATANSNIGMGGPAMIEGGGLGVFRPEEVGPMDVQVAQRRRRHRRRRTRPRPSQVAKQYLSYFQGPVARLGVRRPAPAAPRHPREPPARLRHAPRDRDARRRRLGARAAAALRPRHGHRAVRIEGRPIGVIANNPMHLAGAIDSDGADKAARFMQLCDAFDIPILFLCDTPGIMVGPEIEKTALVRHCSRACSSPAPTSPCRSSPSSCARPTGSAPGDGRRQLQACPSSPSPGRPASSAAWASRAR